MKKNMFGTDDFAPSGLSMMRCVYLIGLHPILVYVAPSGLGMIWVTYLIGLYSIIEYLALSGQRILGINKFRNLKKRKP